MFVTFETTSGASVALNPMHVVCIVRATVGIGTEIQMVNGERFRLSSDLGKICAKLERRGGELAVEPQMRLYAHG